MFSSLGKTPAPSTWLLGSSSNENSLPAIHRCKPNDLSTWQLVKPTSALEAAHPGVRYKCKGCGTQMVR